MNGLSRNLTTMLLITAVCSLATVHAAAPNAPGPAVGAPAAGRGAAGGGPGGAGAFGAGAGGAGFGGAGGFGGGRGGRGAVPAGPPAPVPAEVAMPRPTSAELLQMNDELNRLIQTDASPVKSTLDKYRSLISVTPPRDNPCIRPTGGGVRAPRHDAFVETAKSGDFDILFEGDSITDWWTQTDAKKAMFTKYFGDSKVANFAVAGDTTQGVLWGLQNGEAQGHKPKAIMLMIGTNNTGSNTGPEIAEGVGAIILENRKDFPDAKILLLAIFPRGTGPTDASRLKNDEANKIIARLADNQHVFFKDIGDKFLDPETKAFLPGAFQNDNLHPTDKGYDLWGAAVADQLKAWAK